MTISIIVAMSQNRVIGSNGTIPWRLPKDMVYFKNTTMGHPAISGRRTYESIPDKWRPLPGRTNVVVTRNHALTFPGCIMAHSLEEALTLVREAPDHEEVFVTGGASLYAEAIPLAARIYMTDVQAEVVGDTFFPEFDESLWDVADVGGFEEDEKHACGARFLIYARKQPDDT